MAQRTAVEWLIEKLFSHSGHIDILDVATINDYWEQAKQMEKEQQFRFFIAGQLSMEEGGKDFEQYYKETYDRATDTE